MIYLKRHSSPNGIVLAMCDEELIGKILKEDKIELDLDTYSGFYKGELMAEEDANELITDEDLYSANIVGERSLLIVMEKGLVKKEEVRRVSGVPFVQIFKIIY